MKRLVLLTTPLWLAAGCSSSDVEHDEREWRTHENAIEERSRIEEEGPREVETERLGQVPLADGLVIRPGQWRSTTRLNNIHLPGQSANMQRFLDRLAAQTGDSMSVGRCVTEEEAAEPVPATFGPKSTDCAHPEFSLADGRVRIVSHCENAQGNVADFEMAGTYNATRARLSMDVDMNSPTIGRMRFSGETTSRHVSDTCS